MPCERRRQPSPATPSVAIGWLARLSYSTHLPEAPPTRGQSNLVSLRPLQIAMANPGNVTGNHTDQNKGQRGWPYWISSKYIGYKNSIGISSYTEKNEPHSSHSSPPFSDFPVHAPIPHPLTLSIHHSYHPQLPLSFTPGSKPIPLSQIFPTIHSLPASGLAPRTLPLDRFF